MAPANLTGTKLSNQETRVSFCKELYFISLLYDNLCCCYLRLEKVHGLSYTQLNIYSWVKIQSGTLRHVASPSPWCWHLILRCWMVVSHISVVPGRLRYSELSQVSSLDQSIFRSESLHALPLQKLHCSPVDLCTVLWLAEGSQLLLDVLQPHIFKTTTKYI